MSHVREDVPGGIKTASFTMEENAIQMKLMTFCIPLMLDMKCSIIFHHEKMWLFSVGLRSSVANTSYTTWLNELFLFRFKNRNVGKCNRKQRKMSTTHDEMVQRLNSEQSIVPFTPQPYELVWNVFRSHFFFFRISVSQCDTQIHILWGHGMVSFMQPVQSFSKRFSCSSHSIHICASHFF